MIETEMKKLSLKDKKDLEKLANEYAKYNATMTKTSKYGKGYEDITTRGKKGQRTRKYNAFADKADSLSLSLIDRNKILKKAMAKYFV